MDETLKTLIEKIKGILANREIMLYLVFGVLTTLVDWVVSFALYRLPINTHIANVIAWVAAVLFAYVTNRVWVFESKREGVRAIARELGVFAGGRVATLAMQELVFLALHDMLHISEYIVKVIAAVLVVIGNYAVSKWIVFRKDEEDSSET